MEDRHGREPATEADLTSRLSEGITGVSWRLRRSAVRDLAPFGLTFAQARALRVVAGATEPLRMSDLAARLDVVPRSATTMVDALEAAGLVERRPDPNDRRSVLLAATEEARRLRERMQRTRRAAADEVFGLLSERERGELARLLDKLHSADGTGERRQTGPGR